MYNKVFIPCCFLLFSVLIELSINWRSCFRNYVTISLAIYCQSLHCLIFFPCEYNLHFLSFDLFPLSLSPLSSLVLPFVHDAPVLQIFLSVSNWPDLDQVPVQAIPSVWSPPSFRILGCFLNSDITLSESSSLTTVFTPASPFHPLSLAPINLLKLCNLKLFCVGNCCVSPGLQHHLTHCQNSRNIY